MVFSDSFALIAIGWLLALGVVTYAAVTANWRSFLQHSGVQHFFAGALVVIVVLWMMSAGIKQGLHFHILGVTGLTLLMGWRFALLAGVLVVSFMVAIGDLRLQNWGLSCCLTVVAPVMFTYLFYLYIYRQLSHNPFVYILVAGFLNAGITQALYALLVSGFYVLDGTYTVSEVWFDYLRFLPLMIFPEGVVNGMFLAGMVSFHPQWLSTFDEGSYFN